MADEVKKKREIVFIVYKPEWWGCFDGLYHKLQAEENTICHVLLIPHYKRDGENYEADFSKGIYQPEKMPTEIPLTDYQNFSFEEHTIDTIYIHNPFDDACAADTSHPDFYSAKLKHHTKNLIYIPHLLFTDTICEDYRYCPAYEHVDQICLSDKDARYFLESAYDEKIVITEDGIREYLEKLTAGTNKVRKKGDLLKLLFAVTFKDLENGAEKCLKKLEQVLDYMKTREDVELTFHPAVDILAKSKLLSPDNWKEYQHIVWRFQREHMGRYDDSEDIYRAVADADALMAFGGNPLQPMFEVQGKRILCLNWEMKPIPSEEELCVPLFYDCTIEGDKVWFVPQYTNLICRMDLQDGNIETIAEIPEKKIGYTNHMGILKCEEKLYMIPGEADGIWKYDLKEKIFEKIYLDHPSTANFTKGVRYKDRIYLIPRWYPGIVCFDLQTEKLLVLDDWITEMDKTTLSADQKEPYFIWGCVQEGHLLYLTSAKSDALFLFDMEMNTWEIRQAGISGGKFVDVCKCGEEVYLLPYLGNDIWSWNLLDGRKRLLYEASEKEIRNVPYGRCADGGDKVWAFPQQEDGILCINKKNGNARKVETGIPCKDRDYQFLYLKEAVKCGYLYAEKLENGEIAAYEIYDGMFMLLDENLNIERKISCRLPKEEVNKQYNKFIGYMSQKYANSRTIGEVPSLPAVIEYLKS